LKRELGWWFPEGERRMLEIMKIKRRVVERRHTYQYRKLETALGLLPKERHRIAVDIGAHIGMWSFYLARAFSKVEAFEPLPAHCECWSKNVTASNARLHQMALGATPAMIGMVEKPNHTGAARVSGSGKIPMNRLDSFDLTEVDFIKIDVEGWELPVVQGARCTIERCRPLMIIEQKGNEHMHHGVRFEASQWLMDELGMVLLKDYGGDFIMGWK
jgi:FkbM family methyltransferase